MKMAMNIIIANGQDPDNDIDHDFDKWIYTYYENGQYHDMAMTMAITMTTEKAITMTNTMAMHWYDHDNDDNLDHGNGLDQDHNNF